MRSAIVIVIGTVVCLAAVASAPATAQPPASNSLQLTGGVEIAVGSVEIRADRAEVFLGSSRFVASGNVEVAMDPDRALAASIDTVSLPGQDPADSRVVLSGDVVLAVGTVELRADEAEFDTIANTIRASTIEVIVANP